MIVIIGETDPDMDEKLHESDEVFDHLVGELIMQIDQWGMASPLPLLPRYRWRRLSRDRALLEKLRTTNLIAPLRELPKEHVVRRHDVESIFGWPPAVFQLIALAEMTLCPEDYFGSFHLDHTALARRLVVETLHQMTTP